MRWLISSTLPRAVTFIVGLGSFSGLVQGAGFVLNETSTAGTAVGFANGAALPTDASIMAVNPAGISFLKQPEWVVGGAIIATNSKLKDESGTNPMGLSVSGGTGVPFSGTVFVPHAYYAQSVGDNFSLGLAIYAPFGLETDYNRDFVGRFLALKSHVQEINFQPTLSYKIGDNLSLGIGVFVANLEGTLSREAFPGIKSKVVGDNWKVGAKLGLLWSNEVMSAGVSWTSNVDFKLKGNVKLKGTNILTGDIDRKARGHLKFKAPQIIDIGISYNVTPKATLLLGAEWTQWSTFKEIRIIMDESLITPIGTTLYPGNVADYVPEKWKNVWMYSLGATYKLSNEWLLMGGYTFDQTPTSDKYRTARIPDGDRNWLTVGARFSPSEKWLIDMAYGYLIPKTNRVDEVTHELDGTTGHPTFKGKYKMGTNLFMASVVRHF